MNNHPMITVIVPAYNTSKYLNQCIDSILSQTYQNLEIVLVDDGSSDDSGLICDAYARIDRRVSVVHKQNGGLSAARNAGLDVCKGEYIGFVDGDDYIAPRMYEELNDCISSEKNAVALTGMLAEREPSAEPQLMHRKEPDYSKFCYVRDLLLFRGDASVCSKLFPREVLGSSRFVENRLNEDVLFMIGISENIDQLVFTNVDGYHYRKHAGSTTKVFGKSIHDMLINAREIRARIRKLYPQLTDEAEQFEFRQNISFLCAVPRKYDRKKDAQCTDSLTFIKSNLRRILCNRVLDRKYKARAIVLCLAPKLIPFLLAQKQQRSRNQSKAY